MLTLYLNRAENFKCVHSSFSPTQVKNFLSKRVLIMYFFSKVRMYSSVLGMGGEEMREERKYQIGFDF